MFCYQCEKTAKGTGCVVQGICGKLGPSLPAFLTPNILNTLVKNFDIKPITSADEDLKNILERIIP